MTKLKHSSETNKLKQKYRKRQIQRIKVLILKPHSHQPSKAGT